MDTALRPDSGNGKQAVRIRRFYLATAAYAACLLVLAAAHHVGLVATVPMLRIAAAMIATNAVFFALFATGANQRFPDPSLTWPQVIAGIAIVMYAVYYFDTERGLALMICLVVLPFGAFRFTTRDFLVATGLVLAGYLLVINVMMWAKPASVNVPIEGYRWLTMALVLPCF